MSSNRTTTHGRPRAGARLVTWASDIRRRLPSPRRGLPLVVAGLVASCQGLCANPPWYRVPVINKQTPTIAITGPATLRPGVAATFTVTVTYPAAISTTHAYNIGVQIFEDDLGDVLLDRSVPVRIAVNATSGTATFTLVCRDDGSGNLRLHGDDGSNAFDSTWEVFGWTPDAEHTGSAEGARHDVQCSGE